MTWYCLFNHADELPDKQKNKKDNYKGYKAWAMAYDEIEREEIKKYEQNN